MKAIKVLLLVFLAVLFVGAFDVFAADAKNSNTADDDLLGGSEKGKTFVPNDSNEDSIGGVKEKKNSKKKESSTKADDEDILNSNEVYHLPKVFEPIPHLLLIEGENVSKTPTPVFNITPKKAVPTKTEQPKDQSAKQQSPEPAPSALDQLPAMQQQKEIPMDEAKQSIKQQQTTKTEQTIEPTEQAVPEKRMIHLDRGFLSSFEKSPHNIWLINRKDIIERNAMRTSDLLLEQSAVFMNYRSPVVNYPIIRGRNVRDTAIFVGGINVASPAFFPMDIGLLTDLIDVEYLDSVEILSGSNAVYLGSMANAGALYFNFRNSEAKKGEVNPEATLKFDTASSGANLYGRIEGRNGRIGWVVAGGGGLHDDVVYGREAGIERSTGYDSYSGMLDVSFALSGRAKAKFFAYYSSIEDAGLAPQVLLGINLKDSMPHASLMVLSLSYQHKSLMPFVNNMKIAVGVSGTNYKREFISASSPNFVRMNENKKLGMYGKADFVFDYGLSAGISYRHDIITKGYAEIKDRINSSSSVKVLAPELPDGATYDIISLFLADSYDFADGLNINAGIRYEYHSVKADWQAIDRHGDKQDISLDYTANIIDASAGVGYTLLDMISLLTDLSYTMRAPTLGQLAAYRWYDRDDLIWLSTVKNGSFDLVPEKTLSPEVGIKVVMPSLEFKAFYYYAYIKDRVLWSGNGIETNINGTPETTYYVGNSDADYYIHGVETELVLKFNNYEFKADYTFTQGEEDKYNTPAPLIPPHHGGFFAKWHKPDGKAWVEGYLLWASVQNDIAPWEDVLVGENTWSTIPSDGVEAWFTLNARAGMRFGKYLTVSAGVTNILDKVYTMYGSGMTMPGRSFNLRLSVTY